MSNETIKVPDIGTSDAVEVIEINVKVGDQVAVDDGLIVLESDKASMEVPSPAAGEIAAVLVKAGDKVSEGTPIVEMKQEGASASSSAPAADKAAQTPAPAAEATPEPATAEAKSAPAGDAAPLDIIVPDLGTTDVEIIEVAVAVGDKLQEGDSLLVMESDKASMELPSPAAGELLELTVKVGDKLNSGDRIGAIASRHGTTPTKPQAPAGKSAPAAPAAEAAGAPARTSGSATPPADLARGDHAAGISELEKRQQQKPAPTDPLAGKGEVYAGPAVRVLARELGVDLRQVSGSGPRGRIVKEDLQSHVKQRLATAPTTAPVAGSGVPPIPEVDFAQFGEIELAPMSGIHKATAANMSRSWLNVPHVTQFDSADITDLEDFRTSLKPDMERKGVKLTPMPFLFKAVGIALREHPKFNSSLHADGEHVVMKKYFHVGMAVDTPRGLMVPVIRDVLDKSLWELAAEARELADKARDRKLKPGDMQGGCFTISSLGGLGGTGFTPIVNAPEVAILGVSRLGIQPVWNGKEFLPRKMLPLGLSYDHRQINGADAGAFLTFLCGLLADVRRFVL